MVPEVALDHSMARSLIDRAIAKAHDMDVLVSIVVVDAGGHAKQMARMDGAGWFSPDIAQAKAHAAAAFRRGTDEILQRLEGTGGFPTALTSLSRGRMILVLGACVVHGDGGQIIGAIGVSGARAEDDQIIAQAAVDSLQT